MSISRAPLQVLYRSTMNRFNRVAALFKSAEPAGIRHEDAWTYECGSIFAKQMVLKKGQMVIGHAHHHDHVTLLAHGVVEVIKGDESEIYHAPAGIEVQAGTHHALLAHEDAVAYCIHDVRDIADLGKPFEGH
jgi:quercetin dioxygenase-like cupin family protein